MFSPKTDCDFTYGYAPEEIEIAGPYFDYMWRVAHATQPLLPDPGTGMPVSLLKNYPLSKEQPDSPIRMERSLVKVWFKPFDGLNSVKYGVPEDELELRIQPGKLCPLPEAGLSLKPSSPQVCAVNFPRRLPGLPLSVHSHVRKIFHGVIIDARSQDYGHPFKKAVKGLIPASVQAVMLQYGTESRFWKPLILDKFIHRGVVASEREKIFREVIQRKDFYGLTNHEILTLAPPTYIKTRIEGVDCLLHPWTLLHSPLACSTYLQLKPGEVLILPGTRKAWFEFSQGAAEAVLDPLLELVDVYLPPPPKKVNQVVVRTTGCDLIPQPRYTLPSRIHSNIFGFTVLLDADGCADFPRLACEAGLTFKLNLLWVTSSKNTLRTAVPVLYMPIVRRWNFRQLVTPTGKDVADDYIVEELEKHPFDVVVARDIILQNRCIAIRPATMLIDTPERVVAHLKAYQKAFSVWPPVHRGLLCLCAPVV
jgi:hypothetical protein